jgi:hypothetical protein
MNVILQKINFYSIIILVGMMTIASLKISCAVFQDVDNGKVNKCAEQCTLEYLKSIDSLDQVVDKDAIAKAGLDFSNCMIQCTDATDYVFEYIGDRINSKNVQLK